MRTSPRILTGLGALSLAIAAHANLLTNGSFEDPLVPVGFYTNFPAGSPAITGWTIVGVDSAVVNTTFTQSGITFEAEDGNQWVDLAGVTSNSTASGVQQAIATVAGQPYLLSFWIGSATDSQFFFPTTIELSIDGGTRTAYSNPIAPTDHLDWLQVMVPFTAQGTTTTLTFYNGNASNNFNTSIDNVTVEAVSVVGVLPEPSSLLLEMLGFGVASIAARRRN